LLGLGSDENTPVGYDRIDGKLIYTLGDVAGQAGKTSHESFHFVLNNTVIQDNRIPPYGMDREVARTRNALPVPANQYNGETGTYNYWDEFQLSPPDRAVRATIDLLYQPTSWEYIQFLYLANNGQVAFLADEGKNLLEAWFATGMAEPHIMASATWGDTIVGCSIEPPVLIGATPGNAEITLDWEGSAEAINYDLYYDQADKSQEIVALNCATEPCNEYTDTGLSNGQEYCYKAKAESTQCESDYSNILCATPTAPGQEVFAGIASPLETGKWVKSGKGKNATTTFVNTTIFAPGDGVVIQGYVVGSEGPISGARAQLDIRDETGSRVIGLVSETSTQNGSFQVTWATSKPNKKGVGGTDTGSYTAVVTYVDIGGFSWDGIQTSVVITVQQ
jgi:hypothetical protein